MVNEYGTPLRQLIRRTRNLDRWLDFKSYQVFDEAITYTSLQFFRGSTVQSLTCAFAPDGNAAAIRWETADQIHYEELPEEEAWALAPKAEMELIAKLSNSCETLGDSRWTKQIFQGFKTSGDNLYIGEKITNSDYSFTYPNGEPRVHEIEDSVMYPVIAGPESKRYEKPETKNYILVPYITTGDTPSVIDQAMLTGSYRKLWTYLEPRKEEFEARESGRMVGHPQWWSFIYPKNLRQMKEPKLLVAGTAPGLRVAIDSTGEYAFMGGRVYGILPNQITDLEFLAGVLNSKVADFVFRRIARPKAGGFYDIEAQFLAPLPIPNATPEQHAEIGARARELQELHTLRRDTIAKLDKRLHSAQTAPIAPAPNEDWLWPAIGTLASWKQSPPAPAGLSASNLRAWAKQQHAAALQERLDTLDALLQPGASIAVTNTDDELLLHICGREALRLYDKPDTPFLATQWRHGLRDINVTEAFDAKRLVAQLLNQRTTSDTPLRDRIVALDAEIASLDVSISSREAELNEMTYQLYSLSPGEIAMVEAG
jgi:hypothetical protein